MTRDDIIICDPEGEYFPLVQALKGQVIRLATDSKDYLNPMDIQLSHKTELMEDIRRVMPHIKDSDMEELAEQVLGKLQNMSDEEFAGGYWNRQRKYRKWCWYYSTRNDIIFSVRLEQVGIVLRLSFLETERRSVWIL